MVVTEEETEAETVEVETVGSLTIQKSKAIKYITLRITPQLFEAVQRAAAAKQWQSGQRSTKNAPRRQLSQRGQQRGIEEIDRQSGDIVAAGRDDTEDKHQRDRELGRGMQRMHGRVFFRQLFQREKRVHGLGDFLHAAPVPGYHPPAQF